MTGRKERRLLAGFWGLFGCFALQGVLGGLLSFLYDPAQPGKSIGILRGSPSGHILLGLHYWASAISLIGWLAFAIILVLGGVFRRPYRWMFLASALLGLASFGAQVTGNLLPFDRHDVQTVAVEAGLAGRAPYVGSVLREAMLSGSEPSLGTLTLWYAMHAALLAALFAPWLARRLFRRELETARVPVPWVGFALLLALILAAGIGLGAPIGAPAAKADFTQFNALPSWYVLPLHGAVRFMEAQAPGYGWVGMMVIPGCFVGLTLLLPWIGAKVSELWLKVLWLLFIAFFAYCAIAYGGKPAAMFGVQDPQTPQVQNPGPGDPQPISESLADKGARLFASEGCGGCHTLDSFTGTLGPDLTEVNRSYQREWLVRFIQAPGKVRPGSTMPGFPDLPQADREALAEYLMKPRSPGP